MDNSLIVWIVAIGMAVLGLFFLTRKKKTVADVNKLWLGIPILAVGLLLVGMQAGLLSSYTIGGFTLSPFAAGVIETPTGAVGTDTGSSLNPGVQPTATYATKDKFSSLSIPGTAYYKSDGQAASTTALSSVNPNVEYTYWVSNSTYYVKPLVFKAGLLANSVVNTEAYANTSSPTVTLYDLVNRQPCSTTDVYNTSMGANDMANIEVTYQGTAKKSMMPFGGVLVVESNSTISSVTVTGDDVTSNPFHLTYTTSYTANTYRTFGIASTIDDGSGSVRKIAIQFQNGATAAGVGSSYYVKFFPANYYLTNTGDIVLDTEKFDNQDTTRTGLGIPTVQGYWSA